jgi:CYTH domain-containing protein
LQLHHRPVEIERKFLVSNDEWRRRAVGSVNIRDGLIATYKDRKVRVRIAGDLATVAIKGPRTGLVRPEFEYEIPLADAERMLSTICRDDTLEKQRFFVQDAGAMWHVDVYCGLLQGIVLAEVELKDESQELTLPAWVGKEVAIRSIGRSTCGRGPCRVPRHRRLPSNPRQRATRDRSEKAGRRRVTS